MSPETLAAVIADVASSGLPVTLAQDLKDRWPDLHFTVCSDDDVCGPKPVHEAEGFNLYLVSSAEHCIGFTGSVEKATGLVVAEIEDWEV